MAKDYGIKITEAGYDVATADIENVIFSSAHPFFKIHSDSTSSVNVTSGDRAASITFNHSLGYVPAFIMYSDTGAISSYQRPVPWGTSPSPAFEAGYATSSTIVHRWVSDGSYGNFTLNVRCIIFKEQIS